MWFWTGFAVVVLIAGALIAGVAAGVVFLAIYGTFWLLFQRFIGIRRLVVTDEGAVTVERVVGGASNVVVGRSSKLSRWRPQPTRVVSLVGEDGRRVLLDRKAVDFSAFEALVHERFGVATER